MLVDLQKLRASRLIERTMEQRREVNHRDGSRFLAISFQELQGAEAIVAAHMTPPAARRAS